MPSGDPQLLDRPEARPYNLQNLMARLSRGEIRVPAFQRRIKWDPSDAQQLLDSIFRGYPVGTFLFWLRDAPGATLRYGSVEIEANELTEAHWVVDGQQRIHCLARVLLGRGAPADDFALYFDLEDQTFKRPPRGAPPGHWLPMTEVLDEDRLQEWVFARKETLSAEFRQRAFRLGRIIRQFEIPSYAVRTSDESTVREIFSRINSSGKRMEAHEVFDAIHGALSETRPSRMSEIAAILDELGFGAPEEKLLHEMFAAIRGDPLGKLTPPLAPEEAKEAYARLEQSARAAALFLREDAHIPHISLLPYETPMVGLARFFSLHPEPSARSRELLSRWVWRGALTGLHSGDTISKRNMLGAICGDESRSIDGLLGQIPSYEFSAVDLNGFSFRTANAKLFVLSLLDLGPQHLETGMAIGLHNGVYPDLLQTIFSRPPDPYLGNLANRLIHPKLDRLPTTLASVGEASVLASHGVSREAQVQLRRGDRAGFLKTREQTLKAVAADLFARRARFDEPDDLPIHALVIDEED